MSYEDVKAQVGAHIAEQYLGGERVTDDVKLVSDGIIDSLASLKLVSWLEEKFGVTVEAHEVDVDHLDTLDSIATMVVSKLG